MISSNNNIYVSKCYIKFFYIVPSKMESYNPFSYAKIIYTTYSQAHKKIKKIFTCFYPHIV